MDQFVFTLKDNNQKAFNSFFWFLFFLHLIAAAVIAVNPSNSYQKNMEGSFTIFGEKGTVKIGGQYLNELEYQCMDEEITDLSPGKPANMYGFYQGSMSNHDKVYEHLLQAIADPGYEFASAIDGLKTVEIIEKIYAQTHLI